MAAACVAMVIFVDGVVLEKLPKQCLLLLTYE